MQIKLTILFLLILIKSYSFAQVSKHINEVSKGQIIKIENPSKKNEVYRYILREGILYGTELEYIENSQQYDEISKSNGILKSEYIDFNNFSLYVDTFFMKRGKKFVECYMINDEGFIQKPGNGVTGDSKFEKRIFISNLDKALNSREILITGNFYTEPYHIKYPKRAIERFITNSSLSSLITYTFIYFIIIILFFFILEINTLNREVKMGLVSKLEPSELLRNDLNRYWLHRLYDSSPKLGKMMWEWEADESKLLKGETEYLKKYNLKDQEQAQYISDLIIKIYKEEDEIWGKWERASDALLQSTRSLLKASNLSTKNLDKTINKYKDPEVEKNLKLLINFLSHVLKQ